MIAFARLPLAAALCAALLPAPPAAAETTLLGTEFTYQGELVDLGVPANGNFDFEFRLFDAATGGNQVGPTRTLPPQAISDGVFTVALDFGDQFTGAARWLEIAVRRTGQPGFVVLAPRQPVSPTPYALHADFVADDSIVGASIVNGSVSGADIAVGALSGTQIANGGIAAIDLADASVTNPKLADDAVTTTKVADLTIGTADLANASVTSVKLAAGAVGAAQINTGEVQQRIVGACPTGLPLLGFDSDAEVVCDDSLVRVGTGLGLPKLQLSSRNEPFVLAIDDALDDLVLLRCGDTACSDGATSTTLDSDVGDSGAASLALRTTGTPFIAYYDEAAGDLHAFDCTSIDCTSATFRALDTFDTTGIGVDVALRSGNLAAIAYLQGGATPELRLFDCDDSGCATGTARILDTTNVDATARVTVSIAATGQPVVFYRGTGSSLGLNVYVCNNADCDSGSNFDMNDEAVGGLDSVTRGSGRPMASYTGTGGAVQIFDCSGAICSTGVQRELAPASNSTRTAIAFGTDSRPLVIYHEASALKAYHCDTQFCNGGSASIVAAGSDLEGSPTIDLRSDGRPVLVSQEDSLAGVARLRVDTCGNKACEQ